MNAKLSDGSTLTTVEQEGSLAGEEIGRLWRKRSGKGASRLEWVGLRSVQRAEAKLKELASASISEVNAFFEGRKGKL
jgi:hypothetical protein